MSDARLRSLERRAEHDPDAEARLFEEHVRRGDLAIAAALLERFPEQAGAALAGRLAGRGALRLARTLQWDWLDPDQVRLRPAMYLGCVGPAGLRLLVEALVEPSVERSFGEAGPGRIDVEVRADGAVVVDDDDGAPRRWRLRSTAGGPWAPAELTGAEEPARALVPYTACRAGRGQLAIASALSAELSLQFRATDGSGFEQRYARGRLVADGRSERTLPGSLDTSREQPGSRLEVRPDPEVFGGAPVDAVALRRRLIELSRLAPHVVFSLTEPGGARRTIRAPEGLVATVRPRAPGSAVAHVQATVDQGACSACGGTVRVAAAFGWRADASRVDVEGWANLVRDDAGAHVDGLLRGVEAALSRARRRRSRRATAGARLHGLAASVSVLVPNPTYLGSRRDRLRNPEVAGAVERVVEEQLGAWLELHPREVAAWR